MNNNWFEEDLRELDAQGLRRRLLRPDTFKGINYSSNDYLGLAADPRVKSAAIEAIEKFGTGGTSSRCLAGTFPPHEELENDLTQFLGKQAALVFSSGYHLNSGLYAAIAGQGDIVFADRLCHASILDGLRFSEARFATFLHNDLVDLENLLKTRRAKYRRAFVVTEGTFSMDGDHAPIAELVRLAHQHDAQIVIDEAHSLGVTGPEGKGLSSEQGVLPDIDIFVGTLSKSLGSQGGFIAGSSALRDVLISRCRSFLFTTALAPSAAAAAQKALSLIPEKESARRQLKEASVDLRNRLTSLGYETRGGDSPIIPVLTGEIERTKKLSDHLFQWGFFVPSIRPPTVPIGTCRARLSLTVPVVEKGWGGLLRAFEAHSDRPQRKTATIVETR